MPIQKETSARLVKEKVPYEIISREVIQSLTNPTALAIYVYLISLPENWAVRRQQILDHFDGLGRDRYDAAMRDLRKLGLVWVAETRNALGHVEDRSIVVETIPKVGKPTIGENPQVGKATIGEIRPLKDTDNKIFKDTDIVREAENARSKRFCPPTDTEVAEYVQEIGATIDPHAFVDFHTSKGWIVGRSPMKDWKAAVRTWARREKQTPAGQGKTPTRRTTIYDDLTDTSWAD